ncbi:MAG: hypothetical protein WC718_14340 [Phycisphaerales bacterium]|jgi:hypothetical protein
MNLWQFVTQNPKVIIFLIFLAAPVVKAMAKAFAKAKQDREQKAAMERAQAEALRTGRPVGEVLPPGAATAPDSSMKDQNARRQLEERATARRAAVSRAQQRPASAAGSVMGRPPLSQPQTSNAPTPPPAAPGMIRLKLPNGMVIQVPDPNAGSAAPVPAPQLPPQRAQRAGKRGQRPSKPERRDDAPALRADEAPTERAPRIRAAEAAAAVEERRNPTAVVPPTTAMRGGFGRQSPGSWRRTFIMAELLGKPPGME